MKWKEPYGHNIAFISVLTDFWLDLQMTRNQDKQMSKILE